MFCSISGTVPQEPVVSKKTGHLFEKALIDSHIERTGMCPFSGQSLSKDDLLSINSTTQTFTPPPCPLSATTIPGLLRCMKTEWEAIMLEQFALRTTLESTRQELTDLKHKQEAACRVIARLQVERDEARAMLQQVEASANSITLRRKEEELRAEESNPIFEDAVRKVEEFRVAARRTRTVCKKDSTYLDALTLSTEMSLYDDSERVTTASILTNSGQLISVSNSAATILNARRREILGTVRFFNAEARGNSRSENKPVHITCVDHSGGSGGGGHATFPSVDLYVAGGSDGSLRLVDAENLTLKNTVPSWAHPGSIRSIVSHFGTPYVFSGCSEGHILVGDLDKNVRISSQVAPGPVTSLVLHPDGNVLGVLAESCFLGLDTRVSLRQAVWTAMVPEPDMLSCASLSQNGYHVATGSRGGQIQLWDLRRTPDMEVVATHCCNDEIASISIDGSGTLLAAAGPSSAAIHLFTIKPFQCCRALHLEPDTTGPIVGLHWSDTLCISCDVASPPRLFVTTQQGLIQEYGVG